MLLFFNFIENSSEFRVNSFMCFCLFSYRFFIVFFISILGTPNKYVSNSIKNQQYYTKFLPYLSRWKVYADQANS